MNKIILLLLSLFGTFSITQAQSAIDAAFLLEDAAVCFIKNNRVAVYDLAKNEIVLTATLDVVFPNFPFKSVDAALNYDNGKVYFFSGNQYARLDLKSGNVDEGYPKNTSQNWAGVNLDRIDAAITWSNGKSYLFRNNQYLRYNNNDAKADENYPMYISDKTWPDLNVSGLDAAFDLPNGKTYFFKDDKYYRFDNKNDRVDSGYPMSISKWTGLTKALTGGTNPTPTPSPSNNGMEFFHGSWSETLAKAKANNQLIFVDAYATWCGPCKWMASKTFPDSKVGALYNSYFVNYKFDMEKGEGPAFARKYGVNAYPSLFFINGDGKVVKKVTGARDVEGFLELGKTMAKESSKVANNNNNGGNDVNGNNRTNPKPNPSPTPSPSSKGMEFFHGSWSETLAKAKANNQLIFVDAYATWCGPCKWMASKTFPDSKVGALYNSYFVNYKFDMEKGEGPAFARKYGVNAYPSLFFINGDGKVVKKVTGARDVEGFLELGKTMAKESTNIDVNNKNNNGNNNIKGYNGNSKGNSNHGSGGN